VLATDALAAWFLADWESGGSPWHQLQGFSARGQATFAQWVSGLRSERRLRNDDVTMVRIKVL
jgi:hypothetical protein